MGMDYHCVVVIGIKVPEDLWRRTVTVREPVSCSVVECPVDKDDPKVKFCSNCGKSTEGKTRSYGDWTEDLPDIIRPFSEVVERTEMMYEEFWEHWPLEHAKPFSFGEGGSLFIGEVVGLYSRWDNEDGSLSQKTISDIFDRVEADLRALGFGDREVEMHFSPSWA
jgi:hypothetical protein